MKMISKKLKTTLILDRPRKVQRNIEEFDVFLTVHHSIDLFQVTNLMHTSFIL